MRQFAVGAFEVVDAEAQLLQIVFALSTASGLASLLHSWQEQRDQDRDDRDYYQQFDQSETFTATHRDR
jgi:hypothetical protein